MSKNLINIEVEGEHIAWKNELNEAIDEIKKFENLLGEQPPSKDNKKIEHFQNQFLIQKSAISKIKNYIKKHDLAIERKDNKPFEEVKDREAAYHETISQKIETELKILNELRQEFEKFIGPPKT